MQKIIHFFLVKILIGLAVVGGSVALVEWLGRLLLNAIGVSEPITNTIIGIADALIAVISYVLLFRFYEKRSVTEFSSATFGKYAAMGFAGGLLLQTLFLLVIYIAGGYAITQVNPVSALVPGFINALVAGFVAGILLYGVLFRLTEKQLGTIPALGIMLVLFVIMHMGAAEATPLSIAATAIQAGLLLPATYVLTRSLWTPVFLHFAWDFAEPTIFGGINPGMGTPVTLFSSHITGHPLLTGGQTGPQNSIQSLLICSGIALWLLYIAKRKGHFILPFWKPATSPLQRSI